MDVDSIIASERPREEEKTNVEEAKTNVWAISSEQSKSRRQARNAKSDAISALVTSLIVLIYLVVAMVYMLIQTVDLAQFYAIPENRARKAVRQLKKELSKKPRIVTTTNMPQLHDWTKFSELYRNPRRCVVVVDNSSIRNQRQQQEQELPRGDIANKYFWNRARIEICWIWFHFTPNVVAATIASHFNAEFGSKLWPFCTKAQKLQILDKLEQRVVAIKRQMTLVGTLRQQHDNNFDSPRVQRRMQLRQEYLQFEKEVRNFCAYLMRDTKEESVLCEFAHIQSANPKQAILVSTTTTEVSENTALLPPSITDADAVSFPLRKMIAEAYLIKEMHDKVSYFFQNTSENENANVSIPPELQDEILKYYLPSNLKMFQNVVLQNAELGISHF